MVLFSAIAMLFTALSVTAVAAAQESDEPGFEINEAPREDDPAGEIIPKPNSGVAPETAADRGGALQWLLLGLIVGFFALGGFSIARQSRRAQAARAASASASASD